MNSFSQKTEDIALMLQKAKQIREESSASIPMQEATEARDEEPQRSKEVAPKPSGTVSLSGVMIKDGEMSKTKYFDMLTIDEDQYRDVVFTEDEAKRVSMAMRHMTTGVNASVPMICKGVECPFVTSCPYAKEGQAPVGRSCLVEKQLIKYWTEQFIEEFDVDMDNLTEVYMVSELAELNIYEKRVTEHLAEKHQNLMQEVVSTVDHTGQEIINEEVSRAWELKERIKKNRMKVLEALMATRKERVKLKVATSGGHSAAEQMSDLKSKLEEIKSVVGKMKPDQTRVSQDDKE